MQEIYHQYEAFIIKYKDTQGARHFGYATNALILANEILQLECGMDDK